MPRRERATIVGELLRHLEHLEGQGGVTMTRLAARTNLPYDRFQTYLRELQEAGLITGQEPLGLTPTGRDFLQRYLQWQDALRLLGIGLG